MPIDSAVTGAVDPGRKTNVLIVASSLWIGGAESVIQHLALTLDRRRFNVSVCCLKQRGHIGDEIANAGIDIVALAEADEPKDRSKIDYFTFRKLARVIRDRQIDVVHTHTSHGLVDACLCKVLLFRRLKVVHTFHFGNYPHTRPRIMWMERVFSRLADRLFAVGNVQRKQLQRVYGFSDRAIGTVWNGVSTDQHAGDPEIATRLGAGERLIIGTIATYIEQKGLRDLIQVARKVREAGHDVRFVVVGEGHLRPELEALARSLGVEDSVNLTGWITHAAQVALPHFDVFFQPSLWEAMSMVVLEAMAAGKAVVATRVGENPHIIEDGVDGLLVDPKDVDGMTAALIRVIEDRALRQRLSEGARRKVTERFAVAHMTKSYEDVYLAALR
jgi:glycosyltransferase involved in cell wall biosynthesis